MKETLVSIRDVSKAFVVKSTGQHIQALSHVTLEVQSGTLTALVGPDGAGKSTLMRLMTGLIQADEGHVEVLGLDACHRAQAIQDRISYMPQRFGLYEDLSIAENMSLYADLYGLPKEGRQARFEYLLRMVGLLPFVQRQAGKLSGGMKQKLALACALVRPPALLLLDEPTVGVDPVSRKELWQIVQQLIDQEGLTVVLATSYMDEAERCDDVYIMYEGRVFAHDTPDRLANTAKGLCFLCDLSQYPQVSARQVQTRLLDRSDEVIDAVPQSGNVRFIVKPHVKLDLPYPCEAVEPTLEDGFMYLLRMAHPQPYAVGEFSTKHDVHTVNPMIEVDNLVKRFGDFYAVNHVSFQVQKGQIFGLLGPNGAGKTTTFRMLCGLLPVTEGKAYVAGKDLRVAMAQARASLGYVAQKFSLYGSFTVFENLRFFAQAYGVDKKTLKTRVPTLIEQFELSDYQDVQAMYLPGGVKQRLAMAVGLVHQPDIVFLDEPTSGADPLARRAFWRRISALADAGTTIVITTHFMEEAEYCDQMVIQDAGKILVRGTPRQVRQQAGETAEHLISMEEAFIRIVEQGREAS